MSRDIPIQDSDPKTENNSKDSTMESGKETQERPVVSGEKAARTYEQQAEKPDSQAAAESATTDDVVADISQADKEIKSELDELAGQIEDLQDKLLRRTAEFDNYRKRVTRERQQLLQQAGADVLADLLPVVDSFERALTNSTCTDDSYRQGVELIFNQMMDILKKQGLETIDALGKHFDPELHEALLSEETTEHADGEVMAVLQNGYILKGKVLRHARVKVASASAHMEEQPERDGDSGSETEM